MAHGENAEKYGHPGKEYWKSRLHPGGETPGRTTKKLTHRKERRDAEREIREEVEGRFGSRKVKRNRDPEAAAREREMWAKVRRWFEARVRPRGEYTGERREG